MNESLYYLGYSGVPGAPGLPGEPGQHGNDGHTGYSGVPGQKVCTQKLKLITVENVNVCMLERSLPKLHSLEVVSCPI